MIITSDNNYQELDKWVEDKKKLFLVCGNSIRHFKDFNEKLNHLGIPLIRFTDFQPNPCYESVVKGVELFRKENCDSIMAVGGGSAIDVAKCIKLYSECKTDGSNGAWLKEKNICNNDIPFLAMPTTAGSGSEATRFAVIYLNGNKQSVANDWILPDTVLMCPEVLNTLPLGQKKATMCDALCHAVESYWSVNSTNESKYLSGIAIQMIMENLNGYLSGSDKGNTGMLNAAYIAGKAINITQTTAGHAMCYKITSLLGIAHGQAAMLCNRVLFPWMIKNTEKCIDVRGEEYLKNTLNELGTLLGASDAESGAVMFEKLFKELEFDIPEATQEQFNMMKSSVNQDRLRNFPIALNNESIEDLYYEILRKKENES